MNGLIGMNDLNSTYLLISNIKNKYLKYFTYFKYSDSLIEKKELLNMYVLKCSSCSSEYELQPETVIYSLNNKGNGIIYLLIYKSHLNQNE